MTTPTELELVLMREFSVGGLQIDKSTSRPERRERIRHAIYASGQMAWKFYDTPNTYAEIFQECFGERLDRRAAVREVPAAQMDDTKDEP